MKQTTFIRANAHFIVKDKNSKTVAMATEKMRLTMRLDNDDLVFAHDLQIGFKAPTFAEGPDFTYTLDYADKTRSAFQAVVVHGSDLDRLFHKRAADMERTRR